jgi:mono/diheme cytochrome c family protein
MVRFACLIAVTLLTFIPRDASAQDGDALFDQNCSICHTIGGPAGGDAPDLKGVAGRLDRAWLVKFILDPEGVTRSGDRYAVDLAKKYGGTVMPPPDGLTPASVEAILVYIDQRSAGAHPATAPSAAGAPPPAATFTREEIARGRDLYSGRARFANSSPACASCHDLGGVLAGGTLGPRLAGVLDRLNGAKGLSLWLSAPPTPVMRSIYRGAPLSSDEVRALAAFVDSQRGQMAAASWSAPARLVSASLALAAFGLIAIGVTWRHRFRAVRRPLVAAAAHRAARPPGVDRGHLFRSGGLR